MTGFAVSDCFLFLAGNFCLGELFVACAFVPRVFQLTHSIPVLFFQRLPLLWNQQAELAPELSGVERQRVLRPGPESMAEELAQGKSLNTQWGPPFMLDMLGEKKGGKKGDINI